MLKKNAVGLWIDRDGFVAAVMLKWNAPHDKDGKKHYTFLASPFDSIPVDIVENGEDDTVLISADLLQTLVSRGAARPVTDEEAAAAIKNYDDEIAEINSVNKDNQTSTAEANKKEREKPASKIKPSAPATPVPVKVAPIQSANSTEISSAEKISAAAKKG